MRDKYCLPIISQDFEEISSVIKKFENEYKYFEIWLDYIDNLDIKSVIGLTAQLPGRIILVFRRDNLEQIKTPVNERLEILKKLDGIDCFVDLDISCQGEEFEYLKNSTIRLNKIISFHDYKQTPETAELKSKISLMEDNGPQIIKLSTFCNTKQDAIRLLGLQLEFIEKKQKHIVLGMGENGLVTRIFGTLWGNELAFVPQNADGKTAEGQITKSKFEKIMKELTE